MGWVDRLLGCGEETVSRRGMYVLRRAELAERLRRTEAPNHDAEGPAACESCGAAMEEVLVTTGGPFGDAQVWRDVPVAVDGWHCQSCAAVRYPRPLTAEQINSFMDEGVREGRAGRFADAEWWFTRVVWDWPGFAPGHLNLAEATRSRLFHEAEAADPQVRRRLRERMREHYELGVAGYQQLPSPDLGAHVARAQLTLAELSLEDRAFERATRSLEGCLALPELAVPDRERALELRRYIEERHDLFEAAAAVVDPYLDLMDRPARAIDTPEQRTAVSQAVADLERHYRLAPGHWQAAWLIAMARASLGDRTGALRTFREAWAAHRAEVSIGRELALALLRGGEMAEAREVSRAVAEAHPADASLWCNAAVAKLLCGDLAAARGSVGRSLELDPSDGIARHLEAQIAEHEAGRPLPTTLAELSKSD
jgi:tetratricopeptide (TPR) repeat protein